MTLSTTDRPPAVAHSTDPGGTGTPWGVNEMRLTGWQWLAVAAILLGCLAGVPQIWPHLEKIDIGPDFRIPYALSKDYWLYQLRLQRITDPEAIPVLGDSVIWGEYVCPNGTFTHFLNQEAGANGRFVNCGVNGLFPLAMEGLVAHYGGPLHGRKVIVHCNVLWMTSPKADLSTTKEETFNHAHLVPQFFPSLPCYRADVSERLGAIVERSVGFFGWVAHVNSVYFGQQSIPSWTLTDDGRTPPHCPNAWRNPLTQVTLTVPGEPTDDPQRGPDSARHKPWTEAGASPTHFDWVSLDKSLQWQALQRVIRLLRHRGNDVLVILGPFNEPMVAPDQRPKFRRLRDEIAAWLATEAVPHMIPESLPSQLYADASHPLTAGYARLAKDVYQDPIFQKWLASGDRH